jgi:hypothetical protein
MIIPRYPAPTGTQREHRDGGWTAVEYSAVGEWVDFPDGSRAPREWMFIDATGPQGSPRVVVECGIGENLRPRVITVMVCSQEDGREVRASDFRQLRPLEDIVEDSFELVAYRLGDQPVPDNRDFDAEARERRRMLSSVRRRDRRVFTEKMAEDVAAIYAANYHTGAPTKAVKDHFRIGTSTASLYVKRARELGLIDQLLKERGDGER